MSSEEEALLHYLSCFHKPISLSILAELTATELPCFDRINRTFNLKERSSQS